MKLANGMVSCFYSCSTRASANVGPVFGSAGFLDFYVNGQLCWGVELTREVNFLKAK